MAKDKELLKKIYEDLQKSYDAYKQLHKAVKEDFKFVQGEQWDPNDVEDLRIAGVKALVINKLKPIIKLLTGIERQSQSDHKAFPEGGEDQVVSDVATRLLKNTNKLSDLSDTQSEVFKHGVIGGLSYIEPYMDYSYSLIHGTMKFKKLACEEVFPDPDAEEYDLSDGSFMIKVKRGLTRDQLKVLFPDEEKKIDKMGSALINWEDFPTHMVQIDTGEDYNDESKNRDEKRGGFDLIDYFYKKMEKKYFVAVAEQGLIEEQPDKQTAEDIASRIPNARILSKMVPVIRHAQAIGSELMYDDVAWFYPAWKKFHIIPFFCERITENIGNKEVSIQGIIRGIKDLQEEYNKRRTQELRHLNSSANSGFDVEEGQLDEQNMRKIKKYGSAPGVVIVRKPGTAPINRISPMPLSQGHSQLAAENAQDLKEASGVNPDLLATDSKSQSGRAILLKQRQGLVMIQEPLDNHGKTKRLTGQFILSQFKEIYTIESAMKVLGDAWIADNFMVPVNHILARGLAKVSQNEMPTDLEKSVMLQYPMQDPSIPIKDETGQLAQTVDMDSAKEIINKVLNDAEIGKYDVNIGEGPYAETIRMANFLDIKELATQGVPIPPDTLIELSMIPEGQKKNIMKSLQAAQAAQMQMQSKGGN
jgi:hypothetical protein